MSAFLVSDAHLEALVMTALYGVTESTAFSGQWDSLYFGPRSHHVSIYTADLLGEMLLRENEASIQARYPSDATAPAPAFHFNVEFRHRLLTAVAALKLLDCYEYQSCEHDGWDDSATKRFCNSLRHSLTASLPGYDAAPWALD